MVESYAQCWQPAAPTDHMRDVSEAASKALGTVQSSLSPVVKFRLPPEPWSLSMEADPSLKVIPHGIVEKIPYFLFPNKVQAHRVVFEDLEFMVNFGEQTYWTRHKEGDLK